MSFLRNVARGAEFRGPTSGLARPAGWLVDALGMRSTSSGKKVTIENALGLAPVWAAVTLISETVGMLPCKVYRELDDGNKEPAPQHRAYRMLHDKPNAITPAHRFWSMTAAHLLLWGNHFSEYGRSPVTGLVEELWPLDPSSIVVEWNPSTRMKRYYQDTQEGRRYWSEEEILHITAFSTDGLIGRSAIGVCRDTFGTSMARDEFEGSFYKRGAVLAGVLQHPGQLGDTGAKRVKESWQSVFGGAAQAFGTPVLEEGMTFQQISMPLADAQFIEGKQLTRTDIATIFHLPPAYLGGSTGDSLTYSTVESNQIQFANLAVAPVTNAIQKALASDPGVFPANAWYPEFSMDGLLRGDSAARASYYSTLFALKDGEGKRAISVDEIRALENRPPAEKEETPVPPALPAPEDTEKQDSGQVMPMRLPRASGN